MKASRTPPASTAAIACGPGGGAHPVCTTAVYIGGGAGAGRPAAVVERGPTKQAILDFVARVTQQGAPDFVPPAERIATFDNDGTLWWNSRCTSRLASRSTA